MRFLRMSTDCLVYKARSVECFTITAQAELCN